MLLIKDSSKGSQLDNLRPIAIQSVVKKVLEHAFLHLTKDIIWNNIPTNQLGFKKGGLPMIQTLFALHQRDLGKSLVATDKAKAFDTGDRVYFCQLMREILKLSVDSIPGKA